MPGSPRSRLLAQRGLARYGAWQLRERTHVATYSSRGVGLHARRQGESTTQVPVPEHLRTGEGRIPQPFRRGHQAGGSYPLKGGIRGCSHRGRPYGQRTRKRCPWHLRMQIRGGTHRREEVGTHLRRSRLQHPRGPKTLPRPKRGRVPRPRASLEGGKLGPPERWPSTNFRASLVIHPRTWKGHHKEFEGQIAEAFLLHTMLEWLTVERVRTRLREAGWKGDNKHEFEPVRASRRILRCPQRGQPPARRDVRWPWPSSWWQGCAGYGGVGTLSGRASKGRGPCS